MPPTVGLLADSTLPMAPVNLKKPAFATYDPVATIPENPSLPAFVLLDIGR